MVSSDTIVALASGNVPSGVAVIRVSGPQAMQLKQKHGFIDDSPRVAQYGPIVDCFSGELLDMGLCIWFPAPRSFTGEDCVEFHLHGGRAVVVAVIDSLTKLNDVRLAEAGEFTKRAFENGKFDLTEVEGLSDLISAETEAQRKLALNQGRGNFRLLCENWRKRLIDVQAHLAAEIDFVDEDHAPEDAGRAGLSALHELISDVSRHLHDNRAGEIVRDGFRVVIMGPPNAGKSSLLNLLAKREVAIVTNQEGTTRDVLDVHLDVGGFAVIVSDTAGIRETDDIVEQEGIRRANERSDNADLIVWLQDNELIDRPKNLTSESDLIALISKDDDGRCNPGSSISCKSGHGVEWLLNEIQVRLKEKVSIADEVVISRVRHRLLLQDCLSHMQNALELDSDDIELQADLLRSAGVCIGKLTGRVDVEDLLDVIFSEFCVGK